MRYLLILLLVGCASNKGLYSSAHEYPDLIFVVYSTVIDIDGDGFVDAYIYGYDVDGDGLVADLWVAHRLLGTKGERYQVMSTPFMFMWLKDGDVVAVQHDRDGDGKIDSVSGEVKHIVEWLEKLNRPRTTLDTL